MSDQRARSGAAPDPNLTGADHGGARGCSRDHVCPSGYPVPVTTTDAPSAPGEALPRTRSRSLDAVIEIAITVILAVGLYLVIQTFLVGTYRVEQVSMLPTLKQGQ